MALWIGGFFFLFCLVATYICASLLWENDFFQIMEEDYRSLWTQLGEPGALGVPRSFNDWPASAYRRWRFIITAQYKKLANPELTNIGDRLRILYLFRLVLGGLLMIGLAAFGPSL